MNGTKLKKAHEHAACENLFRALGIEAEFICEGDDRNEPDMFYERAGAILGIEVATAYYEDRDAKQEWTLARGERKLPQEGYEMREGGVIAHPDKLICQRIQRELDDKTSKRYEGAEEIWLCILQEAPLSDAESVAECVRTLRVPERHPFGAIYLLYLAPVSEGGTYTAVKVS